MDEYETRAGARTASGQWLDSTVMIVANSAEEAWQKLAQCNPGMHIVYPATKTGRTVPADTTKS